MSQAGGKDEAFLALLRPLQQPLESYCRRMLFNVSHTEDVLQSAVASAFAQFDRFEQGTNFRAWIFRFVTLELLNWNRKREPELLGDLSEVPSLSQEPPPHVSELLAFPGSIAEQFEDQVAESLRRLTGPERMVLLLRALGEFSYQEIHEMLSMPVGSVMGYLSRARRKMRLFLAEFAGERGHAKDRGRP